MSIDEATTDKTVALFQIPGGETAGCADIGAYRVLTSERDQAEIAVAETSSGSYVTGWVTTQDAAHVRLSSAATDARRVGRGSCCLAPPFV